MDKYHIYEEIGKGTYSQVFKGREKKKIEYVAIKRVEKSMMNKIVTEVQVMHKLESPHTLRFHDWYETRNNLWLIIEYCTGADLESLLKQDGHLPEASVRMFGLDMLAGLKYMHMQGLLHCDLRPCNFLVDEYGILKISDFKLTRKLPKQPLGDTAMDQRGTPPYMAPELFTSEGVHSFTSDFWALGCVLYELRRGFAPFGDSTLPLDELTASINHVEPIESPRIPAGKTANTLSSMSAKLADLLLWMMEKFPAGRCAWSELSSHPFWGSSANPPPTSLPAEPAFESLVRNMEQARFQKLEKDTLAEFGLLSMDKHKGTEKVMGAGLLPIHVSDSTPIRPAAKAGPSIEQQTASKLVEGRIVHAASESKSTSNSLLVAMAEAKSSASSASNLIEAKTSGSKALAPSLSANRLGSSSATAASSSQASHNTRGDGVDVSGCGKASEDNNGGGAFATQNSTKNVVAGTSLRDGGTIPDMQGLIDGVSKLGSSVRGTAEGLFLHSSDTQVKPIVGNKAIEAVERIPFKASALPFAYLDAQEMGRLTASELEAHLTLIYKALQRANQEAIKSGNSAAAAQNALHAERTQFLAYLCAIAPCAEVANVVLNTNFLQLLLRLVAPKAESPAPLSRTTSQTSARAGTVQLNSSTASTAASTMLRIAAASVLATMLRYATFVQPPTAKNRDEHLLPVLVGLLREAPAGVQRFDSKLKRRVVAALGETIFYVSSQEGEGSADKWNVPSAVFGVLLRCLKDDTDEVVRHYAAKTIENIMAQGCFDFRRRLTTIEAACRLLELSQHGRNEALQASCAMALSHMFVLVMVLDPQTLGVSASAPPPAAVQSLRTAGRAPVTPPSPGPQAANSETVITGGRFVARVLEKGGLPVILETLDDGQPKLQQAYLNLLCVLFSSPTRLCAGVAAAGAVLSGGRSASDGSRGGLEEESGTPGRRSVAAGDAALRSARLFFLKASTLVPSLLRLVEQGGSLSVRAKAILLAQLLCTHQPSLLATLAERRLPAALARLIEPLAASALASRDGLAQTAGGASATTGMGTVSYPSSAALCFVQMVLSSCIESCRSLVAQLVLLVQQAHGVVPVMAGSAMVGSMGNQQSSHPSTPRSGRSHSHRAGTGTPGARDSPSKAGSSSAVRQLSASTTARRRLASGDSAGTAAAATTDGVGAPDSAVKIDVPTLMAAAETLLASVSIASQPLLRRLIVSTGARLPEALAELLRMLPAARAAAAASVGTTSGPTSVNAEAELQAVGAAEQSALAALEALAQIELGPEQQIVRTTASTTAPTTASSASSSAAFLVGVTTMLVPAAAALASHPDGDVRVVVAAALRRMVPVCLRAHASAAGHAQDSPARLGPRTGAIGTSSGLVDHNLALSTCLEGLLDHVPSLLTDQPPIPQYAVRMLGEAALGSQRLASLIAQGLYTRSTLPLLVGCLRTQGLHFDPYADETAPSDAQHQHIGPGHQGQGQHGPETSDQDPQLALLLRCLCERAGGAAAWLLEADIAGALTRAVQIAVQRVSGELEAYSDHVTPLIELLHVVLHFVIRSLSAPPPSQDSPGVMRGADQTPVTAQQYRRQVASLRVLCPALFSILATAHHELETTFDEGMGMGPGSNTEDSGRVSPQLQETVSRCLGILFDLFPDAVLDFLLQGPGPGPGPGMEMGTGGESRGNGSSPREILAAILCLQPMDLRLRVRLLKILAGVANMAPALGAVPRVRELLLSQPLHNALQNCARLRKPGDSDVALFNKLSKSLLDSAKQSST